jgi:hypothetical protein
MSGLRPVSAIRPGRRASRKRTFLAPNLAEAVKMVSQTPCAVAHGVVEVWPLDEVP